MCSLLFACGPALEDDGGGVPDVESEAALDATAPHRPYSISEVTAQPGPKVGEVTLRWVHDGKYTTGFVLETALTSFSKTNPDLPVSGRHAKLLNIAGSARSITLTAAQVAARGAPVASGNHLFFRLSAVNKDASGATSERYFPYLRAVLPKPLAPASTGPKIRVVSFNVRTARATTDPRTWLERAPDVAAQLVRYNPGMVAIQELGPGRADGQPGATNGTPRQTQSLLTELDKVNGQKYELVRTTPYVVAGSPSGSQGMRILYDSTRFTLKSSCPDTTDGRMYSPSCSFEMPILATDTEDDRRRSTFAKFAERSTGKEFWFVSTHLDFRHSDDRAVEASYDNLRKRQAASILAKMNTVNTQGLPVIIAGDFNSYQNSQVGNSSHDLVVADGYYDASAAVTRKNFEYSTMNDFKVTMTAATQGVGRRIDMIFVKGSPGSALFENVMKVTDAARPSDHNMIVADVAPFPN